jgi:hypothetical protein
MKGIQALRGLPKELRKKVIANIIHNPFERAKKLNKYLNMDLTELARSNVGSHRSIPYSSIFALGFAWNESPVPYGYWRDKFKELEGYSW